MKKGCGGSLMWKALEFAARAHGGQKRKGCDIPYIVHPVGAAISLLKHGHGDELAMAALLHDTLEDTKVTFSELEREFGPKVARLVKCASEPNKKDAWRKRKEHTIEYLKSAPAEVLLVCCADKLDNIRAMRSDQALIGEKLWERFNEPKVAQEWYYRSLAEIFSRHNGQIFREYVAEVDALFKD